MAEIKIISSMSAEKYNPKDGEVCGFEKEDGSIEYRLYTNNEWHPINLNESGLELNLYNLNQQIISQLPTLTEEQRLEKVCLIDDYIEKTKNEFYMLYGKNMSYFTVFKKDQRGTQIASYETLACLDEIGEIKSIELDANGGIEIWVVKAEDGIADCLYLFPYDMGIIFIKD